MASRPSHAEPRAGSTAPARPTRQVPRTLPVPSTLPLMASAVVAALVLGGCAASGPGVVVSDRADDDAGRFETDGRVDAYTAVVPRAYLTDADLDANAPDRYTVVRGDTLWDISDRFLKKPWLWTEIWKYNAEIADPHLIYPGDELALEYVGGRPTLVLSRNGEVVAPGAPDVTEGRGVGPGGEPLLGAATPAGVERLSPRVRSESLDAAIPTVPAESIRQFLVRPRVVALDQVASAPYVVGNFDRRLMSALGHQVYARGDIDPSTTRWGIYRRGDALVDPVTGERLGHEIDHVADATLLAIGDPSTLTITRNRTETVAGDILLPMDGGDATAASYTPRLPEIRGEGRIVSLVDSISRSGRNQVVVLNLGERSGIAPGDLVAIDSYDEEIIDSHGRGGSERLTLPSTRKGVAMVFRTFDKVSYALVVESTRPVRTNDVITGI